jgi:hypothetical protein
VRPGEGLNGSDRVTLIWPDNAVKKQWLEVTVRATPKTGLASPYVFYFGNAVGETGDVPGNAEVLVNDALRILSNLRLAVDITNPFDIDRDGNVLVNDALVALGNLVAGAQALQWIDLSGLAPAGSVLTSQSPLIHEALATPVATPLLAVTNKNAEASSRSLSTTIDGRGNLAIEISGDVIGPCRLQSTDALGTAPWTNMDFQASVTSENTRRWVLPIEAGTHQRFYRVMSILPTTSGNKLATGL